MTKPLPDNPGNPRGAAHGRARLTEPKVTAARRRYRAGEATMMELATEYSIGLTTMVKAVRGATWTELEEPPVGNLAGWWTEDEDAYLREHAGEPDESIGTRLGRSAAAVKVRRSRLQVGRVPAEV